MGSCKEHDLSSAIVLLKRSGNLELIEDALFAYVNELTHIDKEYKIKNALLIDRINNIIKLINEVTSWKD